jgi:hypothetical protein
VREALIAATLTLSACVFPGQEPTGLELSWRFVEGNPADGDEGIRVRTCAGADVSAVRAELVDLDDESRAGEFEFDCELGFQTVEQFQTTASDAYIQLNPGDYSLQLVAIGADGAPELLVEDEIDVAGRQITVQPYAVQRATFDWTIELASTDTCAAVTLALHFDDPAEHLAMFEEDDDAESPLYRQALASDRGLELSGSQTPCTAELAGPHVVPQMDRGTYLLEILVDDRSCAMRIELDPARTTTALDLAALPCDG